MAGVVGRKRLLAGRLSTLSRNKHGVSSQRKSDVLSVAVEGMCPQDTLKRV